MQHIKSRFLKTTAILSTLALSCGGAAGLFLLKAAAAQSAAPSTTSLAPVASSVIYLNQGWSPADTTWYYHISQGSWVISYEIFLNLEVAHSKELFRSDANSELYGLVPQTADPKTNPDGLPIGLSKAVAHLGPWQGAGVGLTCAACHEGQWDYKGRQIRIVGGPANEFDMLAYVGALDDALQATLADPTKFDRLAARLGDSSSNAKAALRMRLARDAGRVHYYRARVLATPTIWGPGRIDAIASIVNRLTSDIPGIPENWSTPIAPTKPPFLWNSPQGSWTQWRAAQQDPIERNLIETMGVFMPLDLHSKTPADGLFESNAQLRNLQQIENNLDRLAPPQWPESIFGKIDQQKASAGQKLFAEDCASCHNSYPYTWTTPNRYGKRFIQVGVIPDTYVGTDPVQFELLRPYAITAQLAPYLPGQFQGKPIIPTGDLYAILSREILATALSKVSLTPAETANIHGYRDLPIPRPHGQNYKAAPLDGVWAEPPYLHNGSVPSLYQLLLPADQRVKKFYVGRSYDPVNVGIDTSGKSGSFLMDTTLRGNSNAGHSFQNGPRGNGVIGPLLTDEQRWDIVEYLKSIPNEPGRVTPFGGPTNAVTGQNQWNQ
jgi:hypothetical protein